MSSLINSNKACKSKSRKYHFENLLNNEFDFVQDYAKLELGINLPPIDEAFIFAPENETNLESAIQNKITELAKKSNHRITSTIDPKVDSIIDGFSEFKKAIYHTYPFEASLEIGDIDKEFMYTNDFERNQITKKMANLKAYYQLLGCPKMINLIENALELNDYESLNDLWRTFDMKVLSRGKIEFIRENWKEFVFK